MPKSKHSTGMATSPQSISISITPLDLAHDGPACRFFHLSSRGGVQPRQRAPLPRHESGRAGPGFSASVSEEATRASRWLRQARPRLEALIRVLTHGLEDHLFQAFVVPPINCAGRSAFVECFMMMAKGVSASNGTVRYDLIQNDPQRVDVALRSPAWAHALLG